MNKIKNILQNTFQIFTSAQPFNFSAAVAFYTIFSLPAVLLIVIFTASLLFETESVQSTLFSQIRTVIGVQNLEQVSQVVENARISGNSTWMNMVGIGLLVFSATTVFVALQDGINVLWGVKPRPKNAYLRFVLDRLLSFGVVVAFGFIMIVFLIIDTLLALLKRFLEQQFSGFVLEVIDVLNFSLAALVIWLIFSLIFKILPDAIPKWKPVLLGSLLTTALFIGGKFAIGFYLEHSPLTTTYGVAGSFVAILLWIYFTALLLFIGGAFIRAYSEQTGEPIEPMSHSVKVVIQEVEER